MINRLFLDSRSPRAMSGEEIPEKELKTLFEAALGALLPQQPALAYLGNRRTNRLYHIFVGKVRQTPRNLVYRFMGSKGQLFAEVDRRPQFRGGTY